MRNGIRPDFSLHEHGSRLLTQRVLHRLTFDFVFVFLCSLVLDSRLK